MGEPQRWWDGFGEDTPAASLPLDDAAPLAGPATFETAQEVKRLAGIEAPRRRHRPPEHPDVSGLAEGLGL